MSRSWQVNDWMLHVVWRNHGDMGPMLLAIGKRLFPVYKPPNERIYSGPGGKARSVPPSFFPSPLHNSTNGAGRWRSLFEVP